MAVLTLALLEYGCSGDNDFMVVRGEVSYQGAPIEDGDIKFVHAYPQRDDQAGQV